MKLLLTSAGVTNDSIHEALVDLLGRPVEQAQAIYVPTALHALPDAPTNGWLAITPLMGLGWQQFGILELTAMPSSPPECWLPALEAADVIIVGGGNSGYLSYWMYESGLAQRLPRLLEDKVYVGISAGSMVVSHSLRVNPDELRRTGLYYDDEYDEYAPRDFGLNRTLRLVDFVLRPHLNSDWFPDATMQLMETAASRVDVPLYAIDDQTAVKVDGGLVVVVSEGDWKRFDP